VKMVEVIPFLDPWMGVLGLDMLEFEVDVHPDERSECVHLDVGKGQDGRV